MAVFRIIYTDAEGLHQIVPDDRERRPSELDAAFAARLAALSVPAATPFRIVAATDFPLRPDGQHDRRFREAWRDNGAGPVVVGMPRARLQRRRELLALRDVGTLPDVPPAVAVGKLVLVERQLQDAIDTGAPPATITALRAKRQRLRNLETTIDADLALQLTPAALAAFVPPDLV